MVRQDVLDTQTGAPCEPPRAPDRPTAGPARVPSSEALSPLVGI